MMCWSPPCYIPSFVEIGPPVPEEMIFEGFLPYMGVAAILVMGPAFCHQIFFSLYLKDFIKIWFRSAQKFLRKSGLNLCMCTHDIGPRSRNDLGLQYSHTFIYAIRCLLLLTFRSLAAIGSEKSSFHFFP